MMTWFRCFFSFLIVSLLFQTLARAESAFYFSEIYGEAASLEEQGGAAANFWLKGKFSLATRFALYFGAQWEAYEPDVGGIQRLSPLLGFEKYWGPLRFFAEYRRAFEDPKTTYSVHDPRFGITGGYWWQGLSQKSGSLISDTYGELISVSRIQSTPSLVLFSKLGWRHLLQSNLFLDSYLETFIQESPDPAMGRDAQEGRVGWRLAYSYGSWLFTGAIFHRVFTLIDAPDPRVRVLFSMGGTF